MNMRLSNVYYRVYNITMAECFLKKLDVQIAGVVAQLQTELGRDPQLVEILAAFEAILDDNHGILSMGCELCGSIVDFNTKTGVTVHKRHRVSGGRPCLYYSDKNEQPTSKGRVC